MRSKKITKKFAIIFNKSIIVSNSDDLLLSRSLNKKNAEFFVEKNILDERNFTNDLLFIIDCPNKMNEAICKILSGG